MKTVITNQEANARMSQNKPIIFVYGDLQLKVSPKWNTVQNAINFMMMGEIPDKIMTAD